MNKLIPAKLFRSRRREAGIAAIEFAFCVPILIGFLLIPIFLAQVCWHYTIAQKAAQDAARYLSTVPTAEMMAPASAAAAGSLAQEIIRRQIAEVSPDAVIGILETFCDTSTCGGKLPGTVPATVRVNFSVSMYDPTGMIDYGVYGLPITANYTMRYVGN